MIFSAIPSKNNGLQVSLSITSKKILEEVKHMAMMPMPGAVE